METFLVPSKVFEGFDSGSPFATREHGTSAEDHSPGIAHCTAEYKEHAGYAP